MPSIAGALVNPPCDSLFMSDASHSIDRGFGTLPASPQVFAPQRAHSGCEPRDQTTWYYASGLHEDYDRHEHF